MTASEAAAKRARCCNDDENTPPRRRCEHNYPPELEFLRSISSKDDFHKLSYAIQQAKGDDPFDVPVNIPDRVLQVSPFLVLTPPLFLAHVFLRLLIGLPHDLRRKSISPEPTW